MHNFPLATFSILSKMKMLSAANFRANESHIDRVMLLKARSAKPVT